MTKTLVAGQSDTLTKFYRTYLVWVVAGAPEHHSHFARCWGLCSNLGDYLEHKPIYPVIHDEMRMQFIEAGLDEELPFNLHPDSVPYQEESTNLECHLNPRRIQWVRDHV